MSDKGQARKDTASYYTPASLVDCLLDTGLDPRLEEVLQQPSPTDDPAGALFHPVTGFRLCDPSCGSGAFPVRAARRIAWRVAQLRCRTDGPPTESAYRRALWQVVDQCVFAVDLNPYAVELCKLMLWMDSARPGSWLQFLEPNILHGNSLFGATPKLLEQGIPDETWEALHGDDKLVARELRKRNRQEREAHEAAAGEQPAEKPKKRTRHGGKRGHRDS